MNADKVKTFSRNAALLNNEKDLIVQNKRRLGANSSRITFNFA